ncbi:MAG: hypothetical protein QE263_02225 [Vampirovibrionales bacterium]|nr:hypothetical protein [Vampirovibrionales bacterium]
MARAMVAAARIVVDHPKFNQHSNLSPEEVRANYAERWFMEAGGTLLQHAAMYGAMQGISRWFESCLERPYKAVCQSLKVFPQGVQDAFTKHFGQGGLAHPTRGLIHRATFHGDSFRPFRTTVQKGVGGSLQAFFDSARPHLKEHTPHNMAALEKAIQPFSGKLLRRVAATPLMGVLAGCVTGGILIQFFNDRVFRPLVAQGLGINRNKPTKTVSNSLAPPTAPSTSPYLAIASTPSSSILNQVDGPRPEPLDASVVRAMSLNSLQLESFQRFAALPSPSNSVGGKALW